MRNQLLVEVEPLSEQRWARIERSLVARLESQPRHERASEPQRGYFGVRTWLVAAAAMGALVVLLLAVRSFPDQVTVDHPSRITTGESASHLALVGLTLDVEPQSAIVLSPETQQGMLLVLDRGSVVCDVAPRAQDAPLIVQAGAARVRVVGTRFRVTRSGEGATVTVYQGVVEVTSAGETKRVGAGEQWPAPTVSSIPAKSTQPENGLNESEPEENAESAAPELGDESEPRTTPRHAAAARPKSGQPVRAGSGTETSPRPANDDSREDESEPKASPRPSPQTVFEQATVLERSDPARASQLYRSLESGSDSWAQNALYARGRLEASRGNRAEARRVLGRYLERFPRGGNAADARAVLRRLE